MNIIALDAAGNRLKITSTVMITSGSENVDACYFTFNNEWADFLKVAVFSTADGGEVTQIIQNNKCDIPSECLCKNGLLRIGVVGKNNGNKIMSTNFVSHRIISGANENGAARYSEGYVPESTTDPWLDSGSDDIGYDLDSIDIDVENTGFSLDDLSLVYPEYLKKKTTQNGNIYFVFDTGNSSNTAAVKTDSDFTKRAAAKFISELCSSSGNQSMMSKVYSTVRFIIFSGENYSEIFEDAQINHVDCAAEFRLENLGDYSKKIVLSSSGIEKKIMKTVDDFDKLFNETNAVVFVKESDGFSDYAKANLSAESCGFEWNENDIDSEKFNEFFKRIMLSMLSDNSALTRSFTKHILWRSSTPEDTFEMSETMSTMWLSLYKTALDGFYDITLTGYALVKSDNGAVVTLRPVLYQENIDKQARFTDSSFDVECSVRPGITSVTFNTVIYGSYSSALSEDSTYPSKIGAVVRSKASSGDAEIIGFSYTLNAVESDGKNTEILIPQGLVSDYESEDDSPVFMVKTFEAEAEDVE